MIYPPYQIPYVHEASVEEINRIIEQINRALLDIYKRQGAAK